MSSEHEKPKADLERQVEAAAAGDKSAAREILNAVQDDVYGLALRMLGHPEDAEDAAQEILVIVLTHLGSFRAESSLRTWVWKIAVNHLARVRKGRRETVSFETLDERLRTGLLDEPSPRPDPEAEVLAGELRLRCTEAMVLSLDRELRIAYIVGDIFELSSDEAAEVLDIEPAAYRKRLSRARSRLYDFMRGWCGVYDEANPCRCRGQVDCAIERGLLAPNDLYLTKQRTRPAISTLRQATAEVTELMHVAQVLCGPSSYLAPTRMIASLRDLLDSEKLALLRT